MKMRLIQSHLSDYNHSIKMEFRLIAKWKVHFKLKLIINDAIEIKSIKIIILWCYQSMLNSDDNDVNYNR